MSDPIRCEEAIRMMLEFLDSELEQHDHAAMEDHLHQCRGCYSRMEFEKRLKKLVGDQAETESKVEAPPDLRGRIKKITEMF
ncbi:MAG: zf-HC2 domain-containing protein [Gammaproteobacteria bacterium]|nr:zf-HC2 domain-containing protein [Gammaproteobacteria bacterium]